jgi:hypothetical protein
MSNFATPAVQEHYQRCLQEGCSPRLAEMLALSCPPQAKTDSTFLAGHCNGSQFQDTPYLGDEYARVARAHGQNPKGKVYLSSLAAFPGDPEAWVSSRADVQRVIEKRNWSCEGSIQVRSRNDLPPPPVPVVASDIVDEVVADRIAQNPELLHMDSGELRHEVIQQIKPHWKKDDPS